jgi:hypothetical protein
VKASGTQRKSNVQGRERHHTAGYQKVLDGRKLPIRGLWQRTDKFYARLIPRLCSFQNQFTQGKLVNV